MSSQCFHSYKDGNSINLIVLIVLINSVNLNLSGYAAKEDLKNSNAFKFCIKN